MVKAKPARIFPNALAERFKKYEKFARGRYITHSWRAGMETESGCPKAKPESY